MRSPLVAQFSSSVRIVAVMTVALGVAYPLAVTAFAQVVVEDRADGQLIELDGEVVGSRLIAQVCVAKACGLDLDFVLDLVGERTDLRPAGIFGGDAVKVLEFNVALEIVAVVS